MKLVLKYCFFISILLIPQLADGQSFKKMKSSGESNRNAKYLVDSALYISSKNPSKAFDYIEKALGISIKDGDKRTEASAYQTLGKNKLQP